MHESSTFSASSPTFIIVCLLDYSNTQVCRVISHCASDLHFLKEQCFLKANDFLKRLITFSIFSWVYGHLYIFFGEMSTQILSPSLNLIY